ncbi:HAMP domain-containing sensor histidine kinase [Phycisphaera mikurensis]|uniref:histidine kinase n=1 Tax=Phycisphaera mikurensis (strain NBRC 102666 / KCTC 22515 / FYK2301M01) TaxID=1142394 RepID=I0ID76_PHYMF|nr:HAMP domain-containing sensor histidine kinase [Phycisphaera mikurensis]MBB6442340.1 signal transduction histidine kinase [Phycisphaera mikurensis]BAM03214.1 putative two-component system sensor histidine kinase [Phycisphaera mikurensis NBRC 102666]
MPPSLPNLPTIRLSLAAKCQLLFGLAVLLILTAALLVVGLRMQALVTEGPLRRSRDLAGLYLDGRIDLAAPPGPGATGEAAGLVLGRVDDAEVDGLSDTNPFLAAAAERFRADPAAVELGEAAEDADGTRFYRYARAIRGVPPADDPGDPGDPEAAEPPAPLAAVLLVEIRDSEVAAQLLRNRVYIVAAGLLAGLLAITTFWFVTTRLVLSPVRVLRGYALRVANGDLSLRSDINTGDEFEQLSDVFNQMLDGLKNKQDQLFRVNKSLDLKLVELAESNVTLYEANKMKNEFLANVSHELRTPLNSIIGFAEVLQSSLDAEEAERPRNDSAAQAEKRQRYAGNIILSSKRLLELINDLLDLAKIEAGRLEVRLAPVSLRDTCEGLAALIRPLAEKKNVAVKVRLEPGLPTLTTDAGKLQQILFNLLANAVKFSPPGGVVTLGVGEEDATGRLLFRVSDQGPGVAPEDQERIFEKFIQLETSVTRAHGGTGLGLTISRELAELLGGTIHVQSRGPSAETPRSDGGPRRTLTTRDGPGPGATFLLTLPRNRPSGRR